MQRLTPGLAGQDITQDEAWTILVWGFVFILLLIVSMLVLAWVRRRTIGQAGARRSSNWTLEALDELLATGTIDQAEHRRLRLRVLTSMGVVAAPPTGQDPPEADEPPDSAPADPAGPPGTSPPGQAQADAEPGSQEPAGS